VACALDSVLGQDFLDFELVCVDDGSTDGTAKILEKYAAKDQRVRIVTNPENRGTLHARVTAVRAAGGNFVLFLDADDRMEPGIVKVAHAAAVAGGVDVVLFRLWSRRIGWRTKMFVHEEANLPDNHLGRIFSACEIGAISKNFCLAVAVLFNKLIRREIFSNALNSIPQTLLNEHICYYEDIFLVALIILRSNLWLAISNFGCRRITSMASLGVQQKTDKCAFQHSQRDIGLIKEHLRATLSPEEWSIIGNLFNGVNFCEMGARLAFAKFERLRQILRKF
jgi:glycosyltransferase involved in cell wall biosynthesis